MIFSSVCLSLCRRTANFSVWIAQKSSTLNVCQLTRCYSSGNLLFPRVGAVSRIPLVESERMFHCRCLNSLRYVSDSTQSTRPYSRSTRHSLRDKTTTKTGRKTLLKKYKDSVNDGNAVKTEDKAVVDEAKLSVFQRFKKAYKEHAKILVAVHLVTSSVWFGSFYYAAHTGIDVISFLEKIGCSDKIISPFRNSSLGDIALAYLMYKLATPARYTVTLAGTNFAIKYLRKVGRVPAKQKGLVKEAMKYGSSETRRRVSHRFNNVKRRLEIRRLKMRRDARHFSTRLKTRLQNVSRNRTLNGHHRDKVSFKKTAGEKS